MAEEDTDDYIRETARLLQRVLAVAELEGDLELQELTWEALRRLYGYPSSVHGPEREY